MGLEEKMHESLPALCFASGVILVAGAAYIGIGHVFTVGYATIGAAFMMGSAFTAVARRKVRTAKARRQH
jgi:hypothetical protein